MLKKSVLGGLLLGLFAVFPLHAATVSFLVIETGLPMESAANQYSIMWENGLLEVFFEAGHIVSNAPIMRLSGKPSGVFPDEAESELEAALAGGVDFFILAVLDYPASKNPAVIKPQKVSMRLFQTRPRNMLYEEQYLGKNTKTEKEEYDNLKEAVMGLVPHITNR
jgi:hypothetical protein